MIIVRYYGTLLFTKCRKTKIKKKRAYNCSVELTGKLNSLSFVINIFLSITCTAENPPGTKTATLGSFSNDDGDFNENGKKKTG